LIIKTLEQAKLRIRELEQEVEALKAENEMLRSRNYGGRKKHDETWQAAYNDFVVKYESGRTIMEMVSNGEISRRTAYRYLAYYRELHGEAKTNK
jgi:hypothetical protein